MILTYNELQILRKVIKESEKYCELLDSNNTFERRDAQARIRLLQEISKPPKKPHLQLVKKER